MAEIKGRAKGGVARAQALTAEQRKEAARKAAAARWRSDIPVATHEGVLQVGGAEIPCAVLADGRRVLTQSGFMLALGRARQAKGRQHYDGDVNLPAFLTAKNLKPFISKELEVTSSQIEFRTTKGIMAFGYAAELLPSVCDVFLDAEDADALTHNQEHIAAQAKMLVRGLAKVGISALVDEATGYQEIRDKRALQALLDKYLLKEYAAWAKRFPDTFYKEMFRLRGWTFPAVSGGKPGVVGKYTMDIVYQRLAPGLVKELEERNPKTDTGRRKSTHHQWLTEDVGHPALSEHIHAVTGLMRAADTWDQFHRMLERAFPRKGEQLPLLADD